MPESKANVVSDELCGQLAAYFSNFHLPSGAKKGNKIQFQNVRSYDNVTLWLAYLGFLAPVEEGKRWPCELRVDAAAMPDFASQSLDMTEADKQTLLDRIITYAGGYMGLPDTRKWFSVSNDTLPLVKILAAYGYADAKDGQFRWTELIGPSMRAGFLWDEVGGSVDDGTAFTAEYYEMREARQHGE